MGHHRGHSAVGTAVSPAGVAPVPGPLGSHQPLGRVWGCPGVKRWQKSGKMVAKGGSQHLVCPCSSPPARSISDAVRYNPIRVFMQTIRFYVWVKSLNNLNQRGRPDIVTGGVCGSSGHPDPPAPSSPRGSAPASTGGAVLGPPCPQPPMQRAWHACPFLPLVQR